MQVCVIITLSVLHARMEFTCTHEPAERHRRDDHNKQALDVLRHVRLRELNADGEEPRGEHDAHDFERERVGPDVPRTRVENVCDMRPYQDAEPCAENNFVDVKLRRWMKGDRAGRESMIVPSLG